MACIILDLETKVSLLDGATQDRSFIMTIIVAKSMLGRQPMRTSAFLIAPLIGACTGCSIPVVSPSETAQLPRIAEVSPYSSLIGGEQFELFDPNTGDSQYGDIDDTGIKSDRGSARVFQSVSGRSDGVVAMTTSDGRIALRPPDTTTLTLSDDLGVVSCAWSNSGERLAAARESPSGSGAIELVIIDAMFEVQSTHSLPSSAEFLPPRICMISWNAADDLVAVSTDPFFEGAVEICDIVRLSSGETWTVNFSNAQFLGDSRMVGGAIWGDGRTNTSNYREGKVYMFDFEDGVPANKSLVSGLRRPLTSSAKSSICLVQGGPPLQGLAQSSRPVVFLHADGDRSEPYGAVGLFWGGQFHETGLYALIGTSE